MVRQSEILHRGDNRSGRPSRPLPDAVTMCCKRRQVNWLQILSRFRSDSSQPGSQIAEQEATAGRQTTDNVTTRKGGTMQLRKAMVFLLAIGAAGALFPTKASAEFRL